MNTYVTNGLGNGYWLNYQTDKYFLIDEHEDWIREHYVELGVDKKDLSKFTAKTDRNDFLFYILKKYSLCRVREHGNYITFEFCTDSVNTVLWSIYLFLKTTDRCGDFTCLHIVNLGKDSVDINWQDFQIRMKNDETILTEEKSDWTLTQFFPDNSDINRLKWDSKFDKIFEEIMSKSTLKK